MTMNRKVFVNGLPGTTTDAQLMELCRPHGGVKSARVVLFLDRMTRQRRGFGFIEMESPEDGRDVVLALNGSDLNGSTLLCFSM